MSASKREQRQRRRNRILAKTGGKCYLCGIRLIVRATKYGIGEPIPYAAFTIDHIIPRSKGGSNLIQNVMPCCYKCNTEKNDKIISEIPG